MEGLTFKIIIVIFFNGIFAGRKLFCVKERYAGRMDINCGRNITYVDWKSVLFLDYSLFSSQAALKSAKQTQDGEDEEMTALREEIQVVQKKA